MLLRKIFNEITCAAETIRYVRAHEYRELLSCDIALSILKGIIRKDSRVGLDPS